MDRITENNVVALLDECFTNGNTGPGSLWAWFLAERYLIERTLEDANYDLEDANFIEKREEIM